MSRDSATTRTESPFVRVTLYDRGNERSIPWVLSKRLYEKLREFNR